MRNVLIACAMSACLLSAGSLSAGQAHAMSAANPAGVLGALTETNLTSQATYACRPAWRCGPYGCGWRNVCFWRPAPYYGVYRPYGFYRPYGGYRRHWW
jgi:hypothetical protein